MSSNQVDEIRNVSDKRTKRMGARAKARLLKKKKRMKDKCDFCLKEGEQRFTIKKWRAVALWTHDSHTDTCAICRNNLHEECIECQARFYGCENQESDCPVAWGECNHVFHLHCISQFLKDHHICPIDAQEWRLDRISK